MNQKIVIIKAKLQRQRIENVLIRYINIGND